MKHRLASIAVLLVLLGAPAAPALADPKADAKARIEKATTLHAEGKFKEALDELTIAYALDPKPELLYAIGQVHVQLGDCTSAISFYERFLASKPAPGPAAAAREAITTCKTAPPEPKEPPPDPDPGVTTPPPAADPEPTPTPPPVAEQPAGGPGPWYTDKLGDALVGGGIVLGVVSVIFYQGARGKLDDAEAAPTYDEHESLVSDAKSQRNMAVGFAIGGAALIGAGVARYIMRDTGAESKSVAVTPISGGGAITWTRSF